MEEACTKFFYDQVDQVLSGRITKAQMEQNGRDWIMKNICMPRVLAEQKYDIEWAMNSVPDTFSGDLSDDDELMIQPGPPPEPPSRVEVELHYQIRRDFHLLMRKKIRPYFLKKLSHIYG